MAKKRTIKRPRLQTKKKKCLFCMEKKTPDFLEVELLKQFVSERGKIFPRKRSGACSKHQRRLGVAIKRARHLSLLPFVSGVR